MAENFNPEDHRSYIDFGADGPGRNVVYGYNPLENTGQVYVLDDAQRASLNNHPDIRNYADMAGNINQALRAERLQGMAGEILFDFSQPSEDENRQNLTAWEDARLTHIAMGDGEIDPRTDGAMIVALYQRTYGALEQAPGNEQSERRTQRLDEGHRAVADLAILDRVSHDVRETENDLSPGKRNQMFGGIGMLPNGSSPEQYEGRVMNPPLPAPRGPAIDL